MALRILSAAAACAVLPTALGGLPPFTPELADKLWKEARKAVGTPDSLPQGAVCGAGTWGDSGQVDQWDTGRSPCWPSSMTISASWDTELMARWSVEIGEEFGGVGRGQLGPGINIARFPWNGRLGEYMSGEDPYFGARMIEAQVAAVRTIDHPAIQVVKHFIPNTIENHRTDMTEVVDERTLFEVYYPAFEAAVNAGVSAIMCSYNAVQCTSGKCSGKAAYACANDDVLNKHLKDLIGFRGIVMSDWDATRCRGDAGNTEGCSPGAYIDNDVAAEAGLDLEMPSCMTFSGGVSKRATEKAARWRWAYLIQGRSPQGSSWRRLSANASGEAAARRLGEYVDTGYCGCGWLGTDNCLERTDCAVKCRRANDNPADCPEISLTPMKAPTPHEALPVEEDTSFCCWWPQKGATTCAACEAKGITTPRAKCDSGHGVWCTEEMVKEQAKLVEENPPTAEDALAGAEPAAPCTTLPCPSPSPSPDWTSGVYKSNPFGSAALPAETTTLAETTTPAPTTTPASTTTRASSDTAAEDQAGTFCCWWPAKEDATCATCESKTTTDPKEKCDEGKGLWCTGDDAGEAAEAEAPKAEAPKAEAPAPTPAPTPAPSPGPSPDWTSGVYKDNPFGAAAPVQPAAPASAASAHFSNEDLNAGGRCEDMGSGNINSPCKLGLADRIIVESTVVLKNKGGILPLTKEMKVALIGTEACAADPLAIGGGSGWNGPSCNGAGKVNVKAGIEGLKTGPGSLACPDQADGGSSLAAQADVIVAVVAPEKASEGTDRPTLQLHAQDVALIRKYSAMGKPLVVAMNAPGPMITNTWDGGVDALMVSWLPGQQNGKGIAMALYNEDWEASGRLPFTWPKCRTEACTEEDELASVPLGDKIANKEYYKFEEKALIGYRWYHANKVEPNYPFGFGLFAYGSGEISYSMASAAVLPTEVQVSATLSHSGPRAGRDVAQLYLSFPDDVPGDAASKPEWVLKGFQKKTVQPNLPTVVTFSLSLRDLSYWDDAPGASHWVCAQGSFRVCVGANARDAIAEGMGACTQFTPNCQQAPTATEGMLNGLLAGILKKDAENEAASQSSLLTRAVGPATGVALVAAIAMAAVAMTALRRARRSGHRYDEVDSAASKRALSLDVEAA